ncbi:uncharacterized protein MELLADRAFT_107429 [Melampsora larici-populina 98AG31]|uniref:Uncharacterized protein n=1 Tax=Melampsora larici-populina (strain 98AG31 / pathotype 3-4-7) TaxID=747676 RepID=F4RPS1_MELLP|nr:uncharacterized protein MELLADRAFT_107429 [Melampsora larici-populina 98AG31]EGG05688.1 hypothetical protein MELLADRAFT_107429 [Melampsora larici-populina 98AG31]
MSINTCTLSQMPSRQNRSKQPHRAVCLCEAYECRHQVFPDANGVSHSGVEVLPATRAAHKRADLRNNLVKSPRTTSTSIPASPLSAQDQLLSDLQRLNIISEPVLSQDGQPCNSTESDMSHQVTQDPHLEGNSSQAVQIESPDLPTPNVPSADSESTSTKTCSQAELARISGQKVLDCGMFHNYDFLSSFRLQEISVIDEPSSTMIFESIPDGLYSFQLKSINPLVLHVALTASILDIIGHSSNLITKWILDVQSITIELSTTYGILPTKSPHHQLLPAEVETLKRIPSSVSTAFGWLELDPALTFMNCCSSCFAMYPKASAPSRRHHCIANIPGGPSDSYDPSNSTSDAEDAELNSSETICGEPLVKYVRASWHVRRFWAMKDLENDEEQLPPISTVELLSLNSKGTECFGQVFSIFSHCRTPVASQNTTNTWLCVQCFPPVPSKLPNPFNTADVAKKIRTREDKPAETSSRK